MTRSDGATPLARRAVLRAALAGAVIATGAGCAAPSAPVGASAAASTPPPPPSSVGPSGPAPGKPAAELEHAADSGPKISLTFHGAGDPSIARQVLDTLAGHHARVTVLAVGTWLAQYPEVARMIRDGGHDLGNHTWSHPNLAQLNAAGVRGEVERCRDRLVSLTGSPGPFFRQSAAQHATASELAIAGAAGYQWALSYDLDSRDFTDPGPDAVRRTVGAARAGSVVSMHLGHPGTVVALPGILDDLAGRGLSAVPATELFGLVSK